MGAFDGPRIDVGDSCGCEAASAERLMAAPVARDCGWDWATAQANTPGVAVSSRRFSVLTRVSRPTEMKTLRDLRNGSRHGTVDQGPSCVMHECTLGGLRSIRWRACLNPVPRSQFLTSRMRQRASTDGWFGKRVRNGALSVMPEHDTVRSEGAVFSPGCGGGVSRADVSVGEAANGGT